MKDEILQNVWDAKETVSRNAPGGFDKLVAYIKNEAKKSPFKQAPATSSLYALPKSDMLTCQEASE